MKYIFNSLHKKEGEYKISLPLLYIPPLLLTKIIIIMKTKPFAPQSGFEPLIIFIG